MHDVWFMLLLKFYIMENSKKHIIISLIALFVIAISFSSCSSNRKCNGKRGIKTPMGRM